ncbi:TetR/AcrR family transcriptional regulator [Streptomyces fuscigenes]|uniref:TetR/AcrR family transcriptional regulator n=1 Tax=Streptomyces fuscigenes TaxID=1528880 RepID=UPI001F46C3B1|nr:TetR/AcrR family transcriptional regulator [Streptomyces fuscigenes]MCF3960767.1 TetR/AcrR family transcriptional regulator [Streptomyces fuscigenes]
MPQEEHAPRAATRPRDSAATRAAILKAARRLFTDRGYDGAGVRDIARAAGVDTRLISRYFGSKEGLFAEVVDLAYEKSMMMTPELNAEAARALLTAPDQAASDGLLLTLRSAANPQAAAIMRNSIERDYQRRLSDALPGEGRDGRAALLVAICSGVLLTRMVLGNTQLNQAETADLIPLLHRALDAVATAPEGVGAPETDGPPEADGLQEAGGTPEGGGVPEADGPPEGDGKG